MGSHQLDTRMPLKSCLFDQWWIEHLVEDDLLFSKASKIQNSMYPSDLMMHKGCLLPQNLNALWDYHATMPPSNYYVHWYHFQKGQVHQGVDNVDFRHTDQPNDRICHLHSLFNWATIWIKTITWLDLSSFLGDLHKSILSRLSSGWIL